MKFEIVDLEELSGRKAKIYSIIILDADSNETLYDQFIETYKNDFEEEIEDIQDTLSTYGHYTGLRGNRIIEHEGESLGDGIVAICNRPNKILRLYAIMFGDSVAIIGGGGVKDGPGDLRNYDGPKEANALIRRIARTLQAAQANGDLIFTGENIDSETEFIYDTEDYE